MHVSDGKSAINFITRDRHPRQNSGRARYTSPGDWGGQSRQQADQDPTQQMLDEFDFDLLGLS